NRFGSTNEIGVFEMRGDGLSEVENPSERLLRDRGLEVPGSAVVASIEGSRPLLVEVQALVAPTHFANPQRVAQGVDPRRLAVVIAVLEKRAGLAPAAESGKGKAASTIEHVAAATLDEAIDRCFPARAAGTTRPSPGPRPARTSTRG